jgi:hypothetical protein
MRGRIGNRVIRKPDRKSNGSWKECLFLIYVTERIISVMKDIDRQSNPRGRKPEKAKVVSVIPK